VAEFSTHTPGTFSWPELATTDQKAGVAFYRALFGWDVNEQPIGPTEMYSMFQMRGKEVAAAYNMRPEERQSGAPPHWNAYVTVANADDAVKRAQELGAKVFAAPFDVMDVGRMAVLQDPTGAVFQVWQAKKHIGAKILNEPGALCWTELATRDTNVAEKFYTQLFGWTAKHSKPGSPMPEQMPASVPSYWMPYFQVDDCDTSTAKATTLGAKLHVGPTDIPDAGRFSVLSDPQGATFALFKSKVRA
jgi:predicted enzyme related to lactoylglutathione lyase